MVGGVVIVIHYLCGNESIGMVTSGHLLLWQGKGMEVIEKRFLSDVVFGATLYHNEHEVGKLEGNCLFDLAFTVPPDVANKLGMEDYWIAHGKIKLRRK